MSPSRPSFSPQPRVYPRPFNFFGPSRRLSHAVSYYCELFVAAKNLNSFAIKQIQTLCAKYPGWGCLCDNSAYSASLYPEPRRVRYHLPSLFSPLCFHALTNPFSHLIDLEVLYFHTITNPFSRNPFPFTSIQNARVAGAAPPATVCSAKLMKR